MLDALFSGLASLLAFFYELVPSYGVAIALFTLTVMFALSPLTLKQTRSMLAMQKLQPEIKKLQQLHKGDRMAMNEAQMALFKEHGVNPLASCLPMLLQAPVFSVLYWVLNGLRHRTDRAKAPREALEFCAETAKKCVDPKYIDRGSDLYHDLAAAGGKMVSFGVDLARAATDKHGSFTTALPYYVLVALAVAASYFQMKRMYARNPQALEGNPQAAMMNRVFPVITGMISLSLPAGIGVYFVVSNLFRILQQEAMYRWDPHVTKLHATVRDNHIKSGTGTGKPTVIDTKSKPAEKPKPDKSETKPEKGRSDNGGSGPGRASPNGRSSPNGRAQRPGPNGRAQPKGSRGRKRRKGR